MLKGHKFFFQRPKHQPIVTIEMDRRPISKAHSDAPFSATNRLMRDINSFDASDHGSMVKKPCCWPRNSANSTRFPHSFNFLAYSSARSRSRSQLPTTTRIGLSGTSSRFGLPGPNGFESGWSVFPPSGNDSLQNLPITRKVKKSQLLISSVLFDWGEFAGILRIYVGRTPDFPMYFFWKKTRRSGAGAYWPPRKTFLVCICTRKDSTTKEKMFRSSLQPCYFFVTREERSADFVFILYIYRTILEKCTF